MSERARDAAEARAGATRRGRLWRRAVGESANARRPGFDTYVRTLRYLRGRQLAARVLRIVAPPRPPRPDGRPLPPLRERTAPVSAPIAHAPEWLSPTRVRLLNVEREMPRGVEWSPAGASRLWTYHLHYFSDLPGRTGDDAAWMRDIVRSWISGNAPGARNAWDPYPTSLRVMNWIKWLLTSPGGGAARGDEDVLASLALQARHLERTVEHDLSANHIFANASALTMAGLFFSGDDGSRWLSKGQGLLDRELAEQILPDGGHYERSPMYHAIVLEQVLDVVNVWRGVPGQAGGRHAGLRSRLEAIAPGMLRWLSAMTHPDGGPAFFNDTTMGVAPTLEELSAYSARLGVTGAGRAGGGSASSPGRSERASASLPDSGYFRLASGDGRTVAVFDAGPIGPDHQPGHGHCDALSFEVSRDGRRVLVNSGISTYEPGPERARQRGGAAHNSAMVDGEEQCELWGAHRCGRRHGILSASGSERSAEGRHSGYAHLPGSPLHHRSIEIDEGGVRVRDGFDGEGEHAITWYLHIHPGVDVAARRGGFELMRDGAPVGFLRVPPELSPSLGESTWHPGFNLSVPCPIVTASWRGPLPADFEFEITWK